MVTAWLLITLVINGVSTPGTKVDGWGPRPMANMETCLKRKADLYYWKAQVLPAETPYGVVTDITAECVNAS